MKQRLYLTFFAIAIFVCGLITMGKALYRWVTYTPPAVTAMVVQGGRANEDKPVLGRDQSPISWRYNPFSLTRVMPNEESSPVVSNFILKGTVIGNSKTAVLVTVEDPTRSYLVKVGNVLFGEEIVAIERGRVVLRKNGKLLTLRQEEE